MEEQQQQDRSNEAVTHGHSEAPNGGLGVPFIGETLQFYKPFEMIQLHPFLKLRQQRYGKTFRSSLLGSPAVVTTDVNVVKDVLATEWRSFKISYPFFVKELIGQSITTGDQVEWKTSKVAITGFVQKHLKGRYFTVVNSGFIEEISSWGDDIFLATKAKQLALKAAYEVLLEEKILPADVSFNFLRISENLACLPIYFPGSKFYTAYKARLEILGRLKLVLATSSAELVRMLTSKGISNLPDVLSGILFAAFETTGTTMAMCLKYIKQTPEVYNAIKHEHKQFHCFDSLSWEHYKSMRFTHQVVFETLRCSAPSFALFRKAQHKFGLSDGNAIPYNWLTVLHIAGVHMDPDNYENPEEFNPWRWNKKNSHISFFAFGGGPRLCPGKDVAVMEVSLFLYHFLKRVRRWEELEDTTIYMDGTLKLRNNMHVRLIKY